MSENEFQPITSQEQLNAVISDRITRAKESEAKKFEGYVSADELATIKSGYEKTIAELTKGNEDFTNTLSLKQKELDDLTAKVTKYESDAVKIRIADEVGLPHEVIDRLRGTTEEEIKADAESLLPLFKHVTMPPKATDDGTGAIKLDTVKAGLLSMVKSN